MTLHLNDVGTWRTISNVYVNDAGTWREIQEIYVNDNGTWRSVFINAVVSLAPSYALSNTEGPFGSTFTDGLFMGTNGSISSFLSGISGTWISPASGSGSFDVRLSFVSGTSGTSGDATEAWIPMSSDRLWTFTQSYHQSAVYMLEVRRSSDAVVVDSATVTVN